MGGAKWVTAQALELVMDAEVRVGNAKPAIDPDKITRIGGSVELARLTNGTVGGRSVVVCRVDTDDGATLMFETSLRLLESAVRAFRARDEAEGRER